MNFELGNPSHPSSLPPYNHSIGRTHSSPSYTPLASHSEVVLQRSADVSSFLSPSSSSERGEWSWTSRFMEINLGPRSWPLPMPAYGLHGIIRGDVVVVGGNNGVEFELSATLEGKLSTNVSLSPGSHSITFLSSTTTIGTGFSGEKRFFNISFPSETSIRGIISDLPPTFVCYELAIACDITYTITFTLSRKGTARKHYDTKTITLLYLPRTSTKSPPATMIPRPLHTVPEGESAYLHVFDDVESVSLAPSWPLLKKNQKTTAPLLNLAPYAHCVNFSMPTHKAFSSGDDIPFTISLVFPCEPHVTQLLIRSLHVTLSKRVILYPRVHKKGEIAAPVYREWVISKGVLKTGDEYQEGTVLLRGSVKAGKDGQERSWKMGDVLQVQYIIRAYLQPPKIVESRVPSFSYETAVELATDSWGLSEQHARTSGGQPAPAIALMKTSRGNEDRGPWKQL